MLRTRSLVILLALLAALTLSATAGARSAATTVVVTLRNTAFTISPKSVAAGPVRFRIVNRGTRTRSFSVAGKKTVVRARATAFLTVTFRTAGITRFVSTVVGSSSGTLRGTITVRAVVSGPTTKVSVSATEFAFALSMQSVPSGTVIFTITNDGQIPHDFSIAGKTSELIGAGQSTTLTVIVTKPGSYAYSCLVPGHAAAGMKGVLTVT